MALAVAVVAALLALASCEGPASYQYPLGDVRNCPGKSPQDDSQPLYKMEVLPGIGFDNLRNLDMGQIHYYNFSTCQVSSDGKYLLPDSVFLMPVQESKVDSFAEYFEHWDNHTSMTSNSINTDASFYSKVSAKFSVDYTTTKTHMHNDKAKSTRVQIRHKLYTVKLQPDAQLHPKFKSRLYDIASNIQNNNTQYAHYLAELTIRDYGTHYLTSMDAGAVLSQSDFVHLEDSSISASTVKNITASASADFFNKVSVSLSFQHASSNADSSGFRNSRTHSQVVTVGGPPFTPNMTLEGWEKGVPDALVAIDRSGNPLHFVITPITLPELPEETVRAVSDSVYAAINRYYKFNTHKGCTNPNYKNFDFNANVDDSTCHLQSENFRFGGIFQTCTPDENYRTEDLCVTGPNAARQINPITGNFSCPSGYFAVHLHSGSVTHRKQTSDCHEECHRKITHFFRKVCRCNNVLTTHLSIAHYQSYWCAPKNVANPDKGYLFGGYYNSKVYNPVTNTMSCPRYFYPLHFGESTKVCVSTDFEKAYAYAVDFAGFESCSVGNPLSLSTQSIDQAQWPHVCPHGYAQHLLGVEDGCEVNFCVRAGAFNPSSLSAPKLPPFHKHPKYKANITNTLVMFGIYGQVYVKNSEGGWDMADTGTNTGNAFLSSMDLNPPSSPAPSSKDELSGGSVAAITIAGTVVLGVVIVVVVFVGRRVVKRRKRASEYLPIVADAADKQQEAVAPSNPAV